MLRVFNGFVAVLRGKNGWFVFLGVWSLLLLASLFVTDGYAYNALESVIEWARTAMTFDGQFVTILR